MRDPRCWREVFLRGGMTLIMAVVVWLFLDMPAWVLLIPLAIGALTVAKWALRPRELDKDPLEENGDDEVKISDLL